MMRRIRAHIGDVHGRGRGNNEQLYPSAAERFLEKRSGCLKITIILKNKRKIGHSVEKKEKQVYLVVVVKVLTKEERKSIKIMRR